MEERGFKVGDVVELKSGGPDMTVEDITERRLSLAYRGALPEKTLDVIRASLNC